MRLIVTSKKDIAGSNVYRLLAESGVFHEAGSFEGGPVYEKGDVWLIATEKGQVEAEHLDSHFTPEYYVFASRHRSVSGERTLTVHTPGNLTDEAKVGGRPRELAMAAPDAVKAALLELERQRVEKGLGYKVSLEVTHHGPTTLKRPVLFVEVGSTEKEWNDPMAVEAVAKAALGAAENTTRYEKGIGIGGNHYAPRHTRFVIDSDAALGHLVPSYALDSFDAFMFQQAVEKSHAGFCFLDWKGMKKAERDRIIAMAEELGVPVRRRISQGNVKSLAGHRTYRVHSGLFTAAEKLDPTRLRQVITEAGGMPVEKKGHILPEFAAPKDIRGRVLKACLDILQAKNIRLSGKTLILVEKRFDPEKAKKLGLSPGPHFAKLKKGMEVNLGKTVIKPEDVLVSRKTEIELDDETFELLKKER